jgi:hypothetical protein
VLRGAYGRPRPILDIHAWGVLLLRIVLRESGVSASGTVSSAIIVCAGFLYRVLALEHPMLNTCLMSALHGMQPPPKLTNTS